MTQKNVKLTDLSGNILIPYTGIEVPTKTSQLTNDSGFLSAHQTIKQNGVTGATSNRYCTCTVAAATAAKTASITSGTFTLEAGAHVIVKFSNANTASNPTLNINGTGAKNIFHNGARITTDTNKALLAGAVEFVYDGTQWQLLGNYLNTITSDTKNTTGATDTSSKIFLVGATAQDANPQTYSHDTVYVDAGGCLNTTTPGATDNSTKAATTAWVVNKGYLTQANVTSTYSATGTAPVNGTAVKAAIDTALTSAYKPSGSIAFASLPTLSASVMGNVYNITDSFTITSDFVEYESGKTKTFPAGSEVGVVNIGTTASPVYKFSVMSGFIDLSGYQQKDTAVTHTASTKVGDTNNPVYIAADGKATAISYTIGKSVPADAKFTDTTYSVFTGATSSAAGSSGLVKAPAAGDQAKFLKGDGTWGTPSDTDTKNTTGSGDSNSKIFLVGATSQAASAVTYSHDTVFVDTNGRVNSAAPAADANDTTVATTAWVKGLGYKTTDNDTKNTAGSTNTSSKIFLVGATSQATNPQTYSHDTVFVDTSGQLNSANPAAATSSTVVATTKWVKDQGYLTTALQAGDDISNLVNDAGYLTVVDWDDVQNKPSSFTPSAHNQASNTINAMTGYSKASSVAAIAATDSLNTAIGKLEKALDGKQASGNYVTTNTAQSISANKVFNGTTAFQNGSAAGCVTLGADVSGSTVTDNTRKLGRMNFHTFENQVNCAFVSTDSINGTNYVEFGGRTGDTTNTAPDNLVFTIANTHNSLDSKTVALEITKANGANFGVQPKYNGSNLATEAYVTSKVPTKTSELANDSGFVTTDTKNTTGTSNKTGTKMFLAAATSQAANPQTYSNSNCYIGTDNCLYSGGVKVLTAHQSLSGCVPTSRTINGYDLTSNISLTASDVGALPADTVIPAAVTESTVSGWGFTKNAGTITGIKMNGASKGTSGVVDLGTVLTAHQTVKVNGVTGATTNNFGTCSTAAGTAAKTVTLTAGTFALETGARVLVKFTVTNTAASPTLNVGGTGAKAIQYRGSAITAGYIAANRTYEFVYDGTNYQLVGDINTDTNNATAQNISTADNTYPILLGNTANATANIGNKAALFGSGIKANPSTSTIVATTFQGNATSATTASKLGSADVGSATQPMYLAAGVPTACTYTIAKSVPSDAKFTDTVYTHPTTSGNKHIPSGGSANQVLVYSSDGTAVWGAVPSHTHSEYFAKNSVISGATDWNTLTTFGCYKIQNTTMTAEYNAPAGEYSYGLLLVYRIGTDNENRVGQTYYPHQPNSGAVLWARMQNGTSWTAWKKVQQSQISKGSATKPVYFNASGNAVECTYELNKTVPSDAKFTDTVYTHPTTSGNKHIPSGGSSGQILKWSADGTAVWAAEYSYTHPTTSGNKHIPSGGSSGQFLKWSADGTATWAADNDTKNTAGSTDTSSKIFLIGATSQAANPQTYSHDTVFIDTAGALNTVTAAKGNNTTKAATTAFVATAISDYVKTADLETMVNGVITQLNNAT